MDVDILDLPVLIYAKNRYWPPNGGCRTLTTSEHLFNRDADTAVLNYFTGVPAVPFVYGGNSASFTVNGRQQHAVGQNAISLGRLQVGHHYDLLAHEVIRGVTGGNTGNNGPLFPISTSSLSTFWPAESPRHGQWCPPADQQRPVCQCRWPV